MRGLLLLILSAFFSQAHGFVGVNDPASAQALDRVNAQATLLRRLDYEGAAANLRAIRKTLVGNRYAETRIDNELAELYSTRVLDIETAVEIDRMLLDSDIPAQDVGSGESMYLPRHLAANNRLLLDRDHYSQYIALDAAKLRSTAAERLQTNLNLLSGMVRPRKAGYTPQSLSTIASNVRSDIEATYVGTNDRRKFQSRLLRVDYEIVRQGAKSINAFQLLVGGTLRLDAVDFSEITFLELSEYLAIVSRQTNNGQLLEFSLDALFRPYTRLRAPNNRWTYSKIINERISDLIERSYGQGESDQLLYYISLNKSRMLLEEGVAFNSGAAGTINIADLTARDGIPRTSSGLPEKEWFKKRLAASGDYLDFYVGGKFVAQSSSAAQKVSLVDRSTMPLNVRDFGVEGTAEVADNFVDDSLYLTQISGGKIVATKRITGSQLKELKGQLDDAYLKVSVGKPGVAPPVPFFQSLRRDSHFPTTLRVSPDKWMAKHPLDYHLGTNITRAVNLFTANESDSIQSISVGGFFNPTTNGKPLPGSEQEAAVIKGIFPTSQLYVRDAANIATLKSMAMPTVLHLSMHGQFNSENPRSSRLAFAGAIAGKGVVMDDPNSLYAKDMASYSVLRDRDLIFAAACQTGLSAADQANENELTGILRPLTANRNKNIILSLWKVDDEATRDFVSAFYQRLSATRDVRVSFHHAQNEVRDKYKLPYYWAAFYLSQTR